MTTRVMAAVSPALSTCLAALCVALAGCATPRPASMPVALPDCGPSEVGPVPTLRLAPAALGRDLSAQQQLTVTTRGRTQRIDVLLEADAKSVRLALVAMGQTAATLVWDGARLDETRAPWLPAEVSGERILSDLQLALWPEAAVRDALPAGWFLDTADATRSLRLGPTVVTTVRYPSASRVEIDQARDGYQLVIESRGMP